jgi:phage gp36-like protein
MPYVPSINSLLAVMPAKRLLDALDDDRDGIPDTGVFDAIAAAVDAAIDGPLSQRYTRPLSPVPSLVTAMALTLFAEALYLRAGFAADQNPFTAPAKEARAKLDAIAKREQDLTSVSATSSATAFTETLKTVPTSGSLLV